MIHDAPVFAATGLPDVTAKVRAFIATAKASAADGLTVAEFGELTVALLRVAMAAVDSLPDSGEAKKAWVLEAVGVLFDQLADKCVPTLAYPAWVLLRPAVRSLVLMAAGGVIEAMLPLVRKAA